ncbi:TPA: hypothetical protein DCZ81_02965 [Candidatus Collierbacteria bacterium]|nr:hypothetical protein [Candidatus Collierbacteria bacterium]
MTRIIFYLSFFVVLIVIPIPVFAVTNPQTSTSSVSATVQDQSFTAPVLLLPAHNDRLKTARPTFSWLRPSPLPITPLNHYDFYLDGAVFASGLADSLISVDFYFYSATASAGTFYVTPKTDLAQGYHTWKVIAYNNVDISATSSTRTFYLDSLPPFISVTNVDQTPLTWTTADPTTIPSVENRYLTVTTANPKVKGAVEASANFKIILVCPTNILTVCTNQEYSANLPAGLWEFTFSDLASGYTYTAKASATDAAGNSTLFPDFFITYGSSPTTPAFPTLPLGGTLTPPPNLLATITPAPLTYGPPVSPTPPPKKDTGRFNSVDLFYRFLIILIVLGLPTHLIMAAFGTQTPLNFVPKFLFILAFPFLRPKRYQTTPFAFITIFIADKLDKPWQTVVSDIKGFYRLKSPLPENILVNLTAFGKSWKNNLFKGALMPLTCLFPLPVKSLTARHRLQKVLYDWKIIPLAIACLTSLTAFAIKPSYPILIYAYLSLQYLFSEYLYPKI